MKIYLGRMTNNLLWWRFALRQKVNV
jgi:hypothetical protein